ncbi:MAG: hypothetical protein IPP16_15380 [Acidimicrobiaceae bacterium]|nr:hypothetical protein [Acidimicrobiaceae bacterium]
MDAPPSDAGLAMLPLLFSDPAGALGQLVHEHGPLVLLEVGPVQALLVTDPDGVREVLVEQQHCLAKGAAVQSTRPILGDGLLTSEGAHHAPNGGWSAPPSIDRSWPSSQSPWGRSRPRRPAVGLPRR